MASRLNLQKELEEILGSRNVYFQPPESLKLKYPCIVYSLEGVDKRNANNSMYKGVNRYNIVTIDADPDSTIYMRILEHFPMCSFDRSYVSDNMNHNSLTLYY